MSICHFLFSPPTCKETMSSGGIPSPLPLMTLAISALKMSNSYKEKKGDKPSDVKKYCQKFETWMSPGIPPESCL